MNNLEHLNRLNEALKELQAVLKENQADGLSQLEIDLSLDKIKRIYEIVLKLKPVPVAGMGSKSIETPQIDVAPNIDSPETEEQSILNIDESIHGMETMSPEIETDEIIATSAETEIRKEETKAGDVLDLFKETPVPEKKDKQPNEKVEAPIEKETVADKLQKGKLKSIKSAIGINEKFFFLNELFNGDLNIYHINIEKLDSKSQFDEAIGFLNELTESFNWNKDSEALNQLTKMLENKFS
jgi:tetratricopeptide (TPR) repeat protein